MVEIGVGMGGVGVVDGADFDDTADAKFESTKELLWLLLPPTSVSLSFLKMGLDLVVASRCLDDAVVVAILDDQEVT